MGGSVSMIDGHIDEVLKPCPFCGSKAILAKPYTRTWIVCADCLAETSTYTTIEEAIEAWNRRADNGA